MSGAKKNGPTPPHPEGGFAYVIFIAVTVIAVTTSLPLSVFGIVFGGFLAGLGDETAGTSLANGILNTVLSLTGLAANILLNQWSCRNVGLLGALLCVIGSFSLLFAQDLLTFIVFFGIFQGLGYGLLLPASLTALNNAFDKKLSLMNSLSQALMVACCMIMPPCAKIVMDSWGFRGAVVCIGGIALLNVPAAAVLTEINYWKGGNSKVETVENDNRQLVVTNQKSEISVTCDLMNSVEPLLNKHNDTQSEVKILHIADRAASIASLKGVIKSFKHNHGVKQPFWKSMDFSLLTSPKYLNIAIGTSLSFTSDICFVTLLPLVLNDAGFDSSEIAITMSIFFGSDLIARIVLSIVSGTTAVKSRYLVLGGSLFSMIFRFGFVWCSSHTGKIAMLTVLGFLRCFIQTPIPLVMSEEYQDKFATAFSLYMVVSGLFTLVFGPLMSVVKSLTDSNEMVCHLLTSCYAICVISWSIEMLFNFKQKRRANRNAGHQVSA